MDKVKIGSVVQFCRGVSYKKEQARKTNADGFIAILRANNIEANKLNFDDLVYVPSDLVQKSQYISNGDIIITMSSGSKAHVGKVAIAQKKLNCSFGAFCGKLISKDVVPKYLFYILQSNLFRKHIEHQCKGTNINNIRQSYILDYEISLPSIAEQERIVSRVEELFSQLDASVNELKTAKERLKVYRQAVLKEAFAEIDTYIAFGHITDSRLGKMLDKEKNTGTNRKYLRNINVRWFSFDLSDLFEMRIEDEEIDKYSIEYDDLVICEGGEPGRCAVWEKKHTVFYQKALHRVRFLDNSNPKFYMYYLWFSAQSGQLGKYFTGTGIKHLTGQSLAKIPVPTTERSAQDSIVAEIESHLSVCDGIEKTVDTALQQAEALRQSILKKAFEGRLA